MKWYIGVDGGGTKTEFAVSSADGVPKAVVRLSGCSHQSIGVEAAVTLITEGISQCLAIAGIDPQDCAGCCAGVPCYGEDTKADQEFGKKLCAALAPIPVYFVNDVEVGWAGALGRENGIHIVAGTGSIAFGRGSDHKSARCGGWTEFFGDEGSCYWIGREAMSLFTKEADGRVPRGELYHIVRRAFALTEDYNFVNLVMREIAPYREKVAQFQPYALQAAVAGDMAAISLYQAAAHELALMVKTLKARLQLPPGAINVSYSGGLFQSGEVILTPLRKEMEQLGCTLLEPRHTAVEGALALAIEQFNGRN